MNVANKYLQGLMSATKIEDTLVKSLQKENILFDFYIDGDWYDSSLEVYFTIAPDFPWEPSLETRRAICNLGFSMVFWNFPDGTEIRHDEPRRTKDAPHRPINDVGYVCSKWDESWIGGPYDCRDKL